MDVIEELRVHGGAGSGARGAYGNTVEVRAPSMFRRKAGLTGAGAPCGDIANV